MGEDISRRRAAYSACNPAWSQRSSTVDHRITYAPLFTIVTNIKFSCLYSLVLGYSHGSASTISETSIELRHLDVQRGSVVDEDMKAIVPGEDHEPDHSKRWKIMLRFREMDGESDLDSCYDLLTPSLLFPSQEGVQRGIEPCLINVAVSIFIPGTITHRPHQRCLGQHRSMTSLSRSLLKKTSKSTYFTGRS